MNPNAAAWLLVGFLGLRLFNRWLTAFVCEQDPHREDYAIAIVRMLGIGSERRAMVPAFLAAAATTPTGMLISYPLVRQIEPAALGALLALSAGALVYVGATHLLPRAEQERKRFSLVALAVGVAVAVVIVMSKG
jgi:ZIP family zinc transporter